LFTQVWAPEWSDVETMTARSNSGPLEAP